MRPPGCVLWLWTSVGISISSPISGDCPINSKAFCVYNGHTAGVVGVVKSDYTLRVLREAAAWAV